MQEEIKSWRKVQKSKVEVLGVGARGRRKKEVEVWTYVEVLEMQKQGICVGVRCWVYVQDEPDV